MIECDLARGVLALLADVARLRAERDDAIRQRKNPVASWDVWPCDPPVNGKQKYRIAGKSHDGTLLLFTPIFLMDELVAGATARAEAAEAALATVTAETLSQAHGRTQHTADEASKRAGPRARPRATGDRSSSLPLSCPTPTCAMLGEAITRAEAAEAERDTLAAQVKECRPTIPAPQEP